MSPTPRLRGSSKAEPWQAPGLKALNQRVNLPKPVTRWRKLGLIVSCHHHVTVLHPTQLDSETKSWSKWSIKTSSESLSEGAHIGDLMSPAS